MDKEKKSTLKIPQLGNGLMKGDKISEVEEKRIKFEEKITKKREIELVEKEKYIWQIKNTLEHKTEAKDIFFFIILQFFPLIIVGSVFCIPGLIFLLKPITFIDYKALSIIIIIIGCLVFLYAIIRFICTITYKIILTPKSLKWKDVFFWKEILNEDVTAIQPIFGYYIYMIKIGGVLSFGIENILIKTKDKEFWIRAYPLRKSKAIQLFIAISCWAELAQIKHD